MSEPFQYDIFLSHSSKAKRSKPPTSLDDQDGNGLERSRVLVLCLSAKAFSDPDWSGLESGTFRFRDPLNKERRFLPLRLDDAPIKASVSL